MNMFDRARATQEKPAAAEAKPKSKRSAKPASGQDVSQEPVAANVEGAPDVLELEEPRQEEVDELPTKHIGGHFPEQVARQFNMIAASRGIKRKHALAEALNLFFRANGHNAIAPERD